MTSVDILHPNNRALEPFLYAFVGDDRNGASVTVLSALARLNLEPWQEAARLSASGQVAATARLVQLLSRFHDVPALARTREAVANELVFLLPDRPARVAPAGARDKEAPRIPSLVVWSLLAVLLGVAMVVLFGGLGTGE
ncbi:MAG: hypothetical protein AAF416_22515 [Pseudomonadota bacterium]